MKHVKLGLAALLIHSTASATPVRFELDARITALTGDYLTMFGDVDLGDELLIQIEADNSTPRHSVDYHIYFGDRHYAVSFPDWSGSTAHKLMPLEGWVSRNAGADPYVDHLSIYAEVSGYGYQHGNDFGHVPGNYWEGADNSIHEQFYSDITMTDGSDFLSSPSLSAIDDLTDPRLYSIGDYSITYFSDDCGIYEEYGCHVAAPPTYGFGYFSAHFGWEGNTIRRGWTDMTASVSEGTLAPLFGLLLWFGIRRRR